ncbi:hypothetical protein J421_5293 (plasmid) [Gemmatirosa kalamazoonensis]|uniref:Uncharacterized protein n=1 Tax=Gemmatirosa kalamazoonensis TaxID=861299 RepID=W0RTB8_9BACT|nr:hypothetical protein [Gemmatirosa kalamazoonensis]AHG92828.1 hypothetical protein J421_5293 [Gemmatirosa kalamazoonensis]
MPLALLGTVLGLNGARYVPGVVRGGIPGIIFLTGYGALTLAVPVGTLRRLVKQFRPSPADPRPNESLQLTERRGVPHWQPRSGAAAPHPNSGVRQPPKESHDIPHS